MGSKRKAEDDIGDEGKRSQRRQVDAAEQQETINPFAGVNIAKVAGNTDDISSSARRLLSGAGSFVTTTTTTTPAVSFAPRTPSNAPDSQSDSELWEFRLNDIEYTFFQETLAKLEDHCQDWGPRADDFIRTVYNGRQASRGVKLPEATATSSKSSKDNQSDQTPATTSTPYTTTPAANITAATPATFGGFGSATFSPLAQQPFTPAVASSTAAPEDDEEDDAQIQFQAAKAEGDVYTDVLEVSKIILYKIAASGYIKLSDLPVRVQSNTTGDVHHYRLIMRQPSTGTLRFNVSITKDTPFTYNEQVQAGKQPVGWIRFKARLSEDSGDETFAIKASVANAKMLHEKLESIKRGLL